MNRTPLCMVAGFALTTACVLGGCQRSSVAQQGRDQSITAKYSFGELLATLPMEVSVPTARAAAESTLRSRGYVVTESTGTSDQATIDARSNVEGHTEHSRISLAGIKTGTAITIESGMFGDEAVSRSILDGILGRLGR